MITAGSKLTSLSQISRALKSGFAVEALLILFDVSEWRDSYVQSDTILRMTDLHESAYKQIIGFPDDNCGPLDHLDMYYSRWEFTAVDWA